MIMYKFFQSNAARVLARYFTCATLIVTCATPAFSQENAKHPEYVKSETCSACHQSQETLWNESDHSWAWLPATADNVLGDFDNKTFEHQGIETRFLTENGKFWIETNDETDNLRKYEIKYTVGVRPLQQYLIELDGGHLQVLDIAWDTEAKRWYMVFSDHQDNEPGNAIHWTGIYKNWNGRCAECHATDFQKNYDMPTQSFASTWSETGVTCEACHGPGQAHVEWAEQPDFFALKKYLGITETGLQKPLTQSEAEREIQMCAGCHSRRNTFTGNSPVPGSAFSDTYDLAMLRPDLYHYDGQIKDEVYVFGSFLQSKMYAAGVSCSNCHNPHLGKIKTSDNGLCTQCHNPNGNSQFVTLKKKNYDSPAHHNHPVDTKGAQCVSCHMPETTYMGVDARRDHRFGIPNPENTVEIGTPNACSTCHNDKDAGWAVDALNKWFPNSSQKGTRFATVFKRVDQQPELETNVADLLSVSENTQTPAIIRASALERLLPYAAGLSWQILAPYLADQSPFIRTAAARLYQFAPPDIAIKSLVPLLNDTTRAVRIAAARSLIVVPAQSFTPDQRQLLSVAVGEFYKSLIASADHPNTQLGLAGLALSFRNIPAAKAAILEALSIDPQLSDAWIMKARLENAERRPDLVEKTMEDAQNTLPGSAVIFHFFGNYLASQRQYDRALSNLEKAASFSDQDPIILTDYAAVLSQAGKHRAALSILDILLDQQTDNANVLLLKASAQKELGQIEQSKETVRQLLSIYPDYPLPDALLE